MSRENSVIRKLKHIWGIIFRALFIGSIGIGSIVYNWPSKPIGDIPISQLTLNDIFKPLFAVFIFLGCVIWFYTQK